MKWNSEMGSMFMISKPRKAIFCAASGAHGPALFLDAPLRKENEHRKSVRGYVRRRPKRESESGASKPLAALPPRTAVRFVVRTTIRIKN